MTPLSPLSSHNPESLPHPLHESEPITGRHPPDYSDTIGGGRIKTDKPKTAVAAKAGNINENIKREPILQMLIDVFEGEVLNHK